MTEEEFLTELSEALRGKVSAEVIDVNLRYYREYLSRQREAGRKEEDIIAEIGTPQMIAKTILSAENGGAPGYRDAEKEENRAGRDNTADRAAQPTFLQRLGWNPFSLSSFETGPVWQKILTVVFWLVILFFLYPTAARIVRFLFWPVMIVCAGLILWQYIRRYRENRK